MRVLSGRIESATILSSSFSVMVDLTHTSSGWGIEDILWREIKSGCTVVLEAPEGLNLVAALAQGVAAVDSRRSSEDHGGANTLTAGFWKKEEGEVVRVNAKS